MTAVPTGAISRTYIAPDLTKIGKAKDARLAEGSCASPPCKRERMTRACSLRVKPDGWVEEPAGIASDEAAATQVTKPGGKRNFTAIVEGST